ncbi:MAG: hypothetical protein EOM24_32095, partial [Chloroflexia bacterium]|nr:hypothetical protein [Chloroflexia bacterium]
MPAEAGIQRAMRVRLAVLETPPRERGGQAAAITAVGGGTTEHRCETGQLRYSPSTGLVLLAWHEGNRYYTSKVADVVRSQPTPRHTAKPCFDEVPMSVFEEHDARVTDYDLIHFEALGPEADHLREATLMAMQRGELPPTHTSLMTPRTVQDYLEKHPETRLPKLITIKTHSVLPASYLAGAKKSVITRSAGYDHLEHLAATVNLASLREYCVTAVAQTVMKLLYAAAGELNHYMDQTATFDRKRSRAFVELGPHKRLTVYGVGKIGKRVYELAAANGLSVQGVDLRQDTLKTVYGEGFTFVSKDEAIGSSNIIVNAMNLTRDQASPFYNVGYFTKDYLSKACDGLIFINVTRGEIAPEAGLWDLYRAGKIMGLGLDVFSSESAF